MNFVVSRIIPHGGSVKEFRLCRADGAALVPWDCYTQIISVEPLYDTADKGTVAGDAGKGLAAPITG